MFFLLLSRQHRFCGQYALRKNFCFGIPKLQMKSLSLRTQVLSPERRSVFSGWNVHSHTHWGMCHRMRNTLKSSQHRLVSESSSPKTYLYWGRRRNPVSRVWDSLTASTYLWRFIAIMEFSCIAVAWKNSISDGFLCKLLWFRQVHTGQGCLVRNLPRSN